MVLLTMISKRIIIIIIALIMITILMIITIIMVIKLIMKKPPFLVQLLWVGAEDGALKPRVR